jgi:hypothetical protein
MSTINYTYNVIVDRFRQFADGHFQLRRFTHGEISQADLEKEAEWPWMHVKPRAINYSPGTRAFSFEIFISDLPRDKEDKTGYQAESITDCSLIFQDLINEIHLGNMFGDDVVLTRPVNSEPFVEQYTHTLTGVTGTIELSLDYDWSACSIPASWNYNTPTDSPSDGWGALQFIESLDQNGVFVSLLNDEEAPGNSYYYGTDAAGIKGWYAIVDNIGLTCETLPDCATIISILEDIEALQIDVALKANTADLGATAFSNDYGDLDNLPTIPAAQVNSDWNAVSGVAEILNKPTIPTSLPPSGAAGGDLQGTYPNPTVHRVHGVDFQSGAPAVDDTWIYVSTPLGPQPFQWQHSKLKTSQVQNDSTVTGTNADDALEHLDSTKQATLVSGTNIKTVNSNSLLGAGNISVGTVTSVAALTLGTTGTDLSSTVANGTTTPVITLNVPTASAANRGALSSADWNTFNGKFTLPALTSGSVLFSNGTTIAQDNANLFWDDTNNRLGIGTASPDRPLHINSAGTTGLRIDTTGTAGDALYFNNSTALIRWAGGAYFNNKGMYSGTGDQQYITFDGTSTQVRLQIKASNGNIGIGTTTDAGYKLDVNGSVRATGSISAASLLARGTFLNQTLVATANNDVLVGLDVQPTFTAGVFTGVVTAPMRVRNPSSSIAALFGGQSATPSWVSIGTVDSGSSPYIQGVNNSTGGTAKLCLNPFGASSILIGTTTEIASSKLTVTSTTQGFLPPRMTNAQRLAIATPAVGLIVYCTDMVEGLYINKSTGWTFVI